MVSLCYIRLDKTNKCYINDIDGAVGKVNLKKKELKVSMEREISDAEIIAAITKAGYQVV